MTQNQLLWVCLVPVLEFVLPDHQYLEWLPQLFFLPIASDLLTDFMMSVHLYTGIFLRHTPLILKNISLVSKIQNTILEMAAERDLRVYLDL